MKYDPEKHHRRSVRVRGYDYSKVGAYFVTICTKDRKCLLGKIVDGAVRLSWAGELIRSQWIAVGNQAPMVRLDEFVVMPNHFHGIFFIAEMATRPASKTTVGMIVGLYKSLCVHGCLQEIKNSNSHAVFRCLWQRNYYERIIRDQSELERIRTYVRNNPLKWQFDKLYSEL